MRRSPRPVLQPLTFGGGQEAGLRPGTPSAALAAAFAAAAVAANTDLAAATACHAEFEKRLLAGLAGLPGWQQNAPHGVRTSAIVSLTFDGVDGESLLLAMEPFAVASGAACSSVGREPSAVLRALGHDDARAERQRGGPEGESWRWMNWRGIWAAWLPDCERWRRARRWFRVRACRSPMACRARRTLQASIRGGCVAG